MSSWGVNLYDVCGESFAAAHCPTREAAESLLRSYGCPGFVTEFRGGKMHPVSPQLRVIRGGKHEDRRRSQNRRPVPTDPEPRDAA